jgi:hypothetical protein
MLGRLFLHRHAQNSASERLILSSSSFLSSNDPRSILDWGDHVALLEVLWPGGTRERSSVPGADRQRTIRPGQAGNEWATGQFSR